MAIEQIPNVYETVAGYLGISVESAAVIMLIIAIWSLVWTGFALWKSARKNSPIWFIVLLITNTIGILEILYIFVFSKIGEKAKKGEKK